VNNEELHNLYSSPDVIRQIKSRRMGVSVTCGMWHVWERIEKCTRFWWETPKERDYSEDQGIGGRMGSEWMLGTLAVGEGVEWIQLAQDRGQ
jgi:hypothetical protein